MRSNGRPLVFYGTTEGWTSNGWGEYEATTESGLFLEVQRVRPEAETIQYVGHVWPDKDAAASLDSTGGFHSPTLAMRETEQLAKEHA